MRGRRSKLTAVAPLAASTGGGRIRGSRRRGHRLRRGRGHGGASNARRWRRSGGERRQRIQRLGGCRLPWRWRRSGCGRCGGGFRLRGGLRHRDGLLHRARCSGEGGAEHVITRSWWRRRFHRRQRINLCFILCICAVRDQTLRQRIALGRITRRGLGRHGGEVGIWLIRPRHVRARLGDCAALGLVQRVDRASGRLRTCRRRTDQQGGQHGGERNPGAGDRVSHRPDDVGKGSPTQGPRLNWLGRACNTGQTRHAKYVHGTEPALPSWRFE